MCDDITAGTRLHYIDAHHVQGGRGKDEARREIQPMRGMRHLDAVRIPVGYAKDSDH